jgi:hypothetical protein
MRMVAQECIICSSYFFRKCYRSDLDVVLRKELSYETQLFDFGVVLSVVSRISRLWANSTTVRLYHLQNWLL